MILLMILMPALGSGLVALTRDALPRITRAVSVGVASAVFGVSIVLLCFSKGGGLACCQWLGGAFAPDEISVTFVVLSAFLFCLSTFSAAYCVAKPLEFSFFALLLLLEALVIAVFSVRDILMFYVFFEASLIPVFFMIGFWGYEEKIAAAFKFLIYTTAASLLFLAAVVYVNASLGAPGFFGSVIIPNSVPFWLCACLWTAFFLAFAVKLPMFPFHTWLPSAHVQSPTIGSVLLAGLLIKLGGYGFLRFCVQMLPHVSEHFAELVVCLSVVSLFYASLVAFAQKNMKMLVAYSSIAHMSFVSAGIFSLNETGVLGAIFQMLSHGLISAALFLCVGMIYNRTGTMEMSKCGGLASSMPKLSVLMVFFSMASVGVPGTSGFVGEFLSMFGIFRSFGAWVACFAVGMVLSSVYMLRLCREVIWGSCRADVRVRGDINFKEFALLVIIAAAVLVLGVFPGPLLEFLRPGVNNVLMPLQDFHHRPSWG
ncbi:MAG: complex I subunit 4 family protein [Anaplasma sp.]